MSRAVMQQALEAMELAYDHLEYNTKVEQRVCHVTIKAIAALREALAEPQGGQQPVAWIPKWAHDRLTGQLGAVADPVTWGINSPLYAAPTNDAVALYTHPAPDHTALLREARDALALAKALLARVWGAPSDARIDATLARLDAALGDKE